MVKNRLEAGEDLGAAANPAPKIFLQTPQSDETGAPAVDSAVGKGGTKGDKGEEPFPGAWSGKGSKGDKGEEPFPGDWKGSGKGEKGEEPFPGAWTGGKGDKGDWKGVG